jgi:ribulose-phosphate 3-epimerase
VTDLPLDVHLMIVEPERHLEAFAKAGASALTVHLETCPHLHRTLQHIRDLGLRAGVAINPQTPAALLGEVMDIADIILVMTVNPGFGGQKFLSSVLPKLSTIRELARSREIDITVDGGIDPTTIPQVLKAGANVLVAGTSIFAHAEGTVGGMMSINAAVDNYIKQSQRTI